MPPPPEPRVTTAATSADGAGPGVAAGAEATEPARQIEELTRQIGALTETLRRDHERAAHREQVIDRLHAENQQLRHGILQEALAPVRTALYRLHDTATRVAARWRSDDPPSPEFAGPLLAAMADEVAEVLGRTGAERLSVRPGDAYDPALHRPAGTSAVPAAEDGTVVEVLSDGFTTGDRVLRKASVIIGRASEDEDGDPAPEDDPAGTDEAETADGPDDTDGAKDDTGRRGDTDGRDGGDAEEDSGKEKESE
ncbi:hypothetical protein Skr01_01560 [Sphaerisporangium krabiense]|uniref:Molecular chaperone GrpE (Heat shock protein) n=1 Tax=Sphaerisporangium krabiense TaxID=763782 RepID=A0A7W8Z811_9ACTN|nr:nucleotide exchange factor GrpE [Sphaerisporangium krabiense]MBB5629089.1 molecular chaperone GrpE (heat shock protein) [Sphaerisporangium krabiense]GII60071.1 hypothetical protein Skr01_01560 [Sphaerisporangium krabiense]